MERDSSKKRAFQCAMYVTVAFRLRGKEHPAGGQLPPIVQAQEWQVRKIIMHTSTSLAYIVMMACPQIGGVGCFIYW